MPRMEALDLRRLVSQMLSETAQGPEEVGIWGGRFAEGELSAFLGLWTLPRDLMPWGIWLWTDNIRFDHRGLAPGDQAYLERGRIFGLGGDLGLRRVYGDFMWRFVGRPAELPKDAANEEKYGAQDYWDNRSGSRLRARERSALLWGEDHSGAGLWQEDRVGWAHLAYPKVRASRVKLCYREYLLGSRVEAVWWLGLQDLDGTCEEAGDE